MATQDQIQRALQAGYTQEQINQYIEKKNPKKTIGGFLKNVGRSGEKLVTDTASAILNPIQTAKGVIGLGSSIISNVLPGQQGNEQLARDIGKLYADRYGGLDKAWETFYNDPVGMAADISTVIGGAGAIAKLGKFGKTASTLSKVSRATDPLRLPGKALGLAKTGASRIGIKAPNISGALLKESDNVLTRGMGNPKALEKARGVSPIPINELYKKYNLYDRSPETFGDAARSANKMGRSMLESAPASIETRRIVQLFDDEISKLAAKAKTSTKHQLAMDELINRKNMYLEGIQSPEMATPLKVDAGRAYDIKSDFQGDLPPNSYGMPSGEIGKNLGVKKSYQTLLSGIEEQAPGIKNVGREQSALRKFEEIAKASDARSSSRQNLNFSKLGSATAGGVVAGIPGAVAGYVGERIVNSPQFLSASSKVMGSAGRSMQKGIQAPQVAKTAYAKIPMPVRQVVQQSPNALYTQARVNRMIPTQEQKPPVTVPPLTKPTAQKQPKFTVEQFKKEKPKNVFNNAAFGKTFALKAGSFN